MSVQSEFLKSLFDELTAKGISEDIARINVTKFQSQLKKKAEVDGNDKVDAALSKIPPASIAENIYNMLKAEDDTEAGARSEVVVIDTENDTVTKTVKEGKEAASLIPEEDESEDLNAESIDASEEAEEAEKAEETDAPAEEESVAEENSSEEEGELSEPAESEEDTDTDGEETASDEENSDNGENVSEEESNEETTAESDENTEPQECEPSDSEESEESEESEDSESTDGETEEAEENSDETVIPEITEDEIPEETKNESDESVREDIEPELPEDKELDNLFAENGNTEDSDDNDDGTKIFQFPDSDSDENNIDQYAPEKKKLRKGVKNSDEKKRKDYIDSNYLYENDPGKKNGWLFYVFAIFLFPLAFIAGTAIFVFFVGIWLAIALVITLLLLGVFALAAAGSLASLCGLIFGLIELISGNIAAAMFEVGLALTVGSCVLFVGILIYNFAVRFLPFIIKKLGVLLLLIFKTFGKGFKKLKKLCSSI